MGIMQGRRFADRYELRHLIGSGGMAEVWQARDLRMDRDVAVKLLDRAAAVDPAAIERFRREALAVARIAHPNIVSAYDFGTERDRSYLVMELVPGETLDARLARGPVPIRQAIDVAAQTCAALDAAHRAGVIHRDVKPGNIIITPDGTVKVLDFGIARLQDAAGSLTRTATVVGTSHYMASEQASGGATSGRTDLYAVGCVLYAMLTGAPPFGGANPMGVLYQHLHSAPPRVSEKRPDVPPALDQLVAELLAKDPADRPESAAMVRARLTHLANGPGLTSALPTVPGPAAAARSAPGPAAAPRSAPGRAAVPAPAPPLTETFATPSPDQSRVWPRWLVPVAVTVVGVIVLAIVVLALWPDGERTAGPPATHPPSASPSPTPSPRATDPAGRLAELRAVLAEQVAAGEVDSDAAHKIDDALDKIAEDLQKGQLEEAAGHVAELQDKLDELVRDGGISRAAYDALSAGLDRLAAVLPEPGGGEKPGKGRGHSKGKKDD
jgi:serine/threonine-protein kinase